MPRVIISETYPQAFILPVHTGLARTDAKTATIADDPVVAGYITPFRVSAGHSRLWIIIICSSAADEYEFTINLTAVAFLLMVDVVSAVFEASAVTFDHTGAVPFKTFLNVS